MYRHKPMKGVRNQMFRITIDLTTGERKILDLGQQAGDDEVLKVFAKIAAREIMAGAGRVAQPSYRQDHLIRPDKKC